MPYNILLLPLLGGYVFVSWWYRTRWYTKRAEKERLIIYASLAGIVHLGIAFAILLFSRTRVPGSPFYWLQSIHEWWLHHFDFPYSGTAVLALMIGVIGGHILNGFASLWTWGRAKDTANARIIRDCGGPFEQTLYVSIEQKTLVLLTLTNGKVYIGKIAKTFIPDDRVVYLFPQKSGFRDPARHSVEITTHYDVVYTNIGVDNWDETLPPEKQPYLKILELFRIAIPVEYLVSVTLYDLDLHKKYFPRKLHIAPLCLPISWASQPPATAIAVPAATPVATATTESEPVATAAAAPSPPVAEIVAPENPAESIIISPAVENPDTLTPPKPPES